VHSRYTGCGYYTGHGGGGSDVIGRAADKKLPTAQPYGAETSCRVCIGRYVALVVGGRGKRPSSMRIRLKNPYGFASHLWNLGRAMGPGGG